MPVPMVANFRGAGTGRWGGGRGAQVFLQILIDQLTPTLTRWSKLCPPHYYLPSRFSDLPTSLLTSYFYHDSRSWARTTIFFFLSFFHFSFYFQFLSRNYKKLFWGEEWKMKKKKGFYYDSRSWACMYHYIFFLFFIIFFNFCPEIMKWYFVTKIVLTYCEKKLF